MEAFTTWFTILSSIATLISVILLLKFEYRKRHQELIQAITNQKDKEFEKEKEWIAKFKEFEISYDEELERIKMSIQKVESEKAIDMEKLRASLEKLMVSVEALNAKVTELVQRISDLEKFTKTIHEFIGFTKGEKSSRRKNVE